MNINNKKIHQSYMIIFFILLLFAMCLTMNALLGGNPGLYELLDKETVVETGIISESTLADKDDDNTVCLNSLFLESHSTRKMLPAEGFLHENNAHSATVTKNICPMSMAAVIPNGSDLLLFLIVAVLFYFWNSFILLPDERTLMNQKVRLDN